MRTDNTSSYYFPQLFNEGKNRKKGAALARTDDDSCWENNDNNNDNSFSLIQEEKEPQCDITINSGITFYLEELPLLTEEGGQMPVGAQGWYASAVLSAMLFLPRPGEDTKRHQLHQDLEQALLRQRKSPKSSPFTVLELGSGTIGLSGIAMAWYLAQQQPLEGNENLDSRIILTDYDTQCLHQLQKKCDSAKVSLETYGEASPIAQPDIRVEHLDWQEHAQEQSTLDKENYGNIDIVLGAALVYTEENSCCAAQIAKILKQNTSAIVWIVQYPRDGWFNVLQQDLFRRLPGVKICKYRPTDLHADVHEMAETMMSRQRGDAFAVEHMRAIRVSYGGN